VERKGNFLNLESQILGSLLPESRTLKRVTIEIPHLYGKKPVGLDISSNPCGVSSGKKRKPLRGKFWGSESRKFRERGSQKICTHKFLIV
jgi:hypothetical protein